MKTKEIDVWVQKLVISDKYKYEAFMEGRSCQMSRTEKDGYYKAKLIIEIPEKKIEITESEFDKVYATYISALGVDKHYQFEHMVEMKKELGF